MTRIPIATSESMIEELEGWVGMETPTDDPAAVNRLIDVAGQGLANAAQTGAGGAVTRIPGIENRGDILIARTPGDGRPIVVAGHLDTVWPVGTLAKMPFRVEGDQAHGPGIYDMKAGSFIAFHVVRAILAGAIKMPRPITLLLTPDEEVGSPTSRAVIEREAERAHAVLIMEPAAASGACVTARKGVGRFVLEVLGVGSHAGSAYGDGASAVIELARQILAIHAMVDVAGGTTLNVAPIWGGTRPNVIPSAAGCEIDLRVATAADGARMEAAIRGLKALDPRCSLSITGGMNRPPFAETEGIAALYQRAKGIADDLGVALPKQHRGGGSDGNFTAALGVPTLDGLGCPGAGAHASHEHIQWRQLAPRAALLARLLETLD